MSAGDVWITGAGGFLGRTLAECLAEGGRRVFGIGHGDGGPSLRAWVQADVDAVGLDRLLAAAGQAPAAVFHLAGGASVAAAEADPDADHARTVGSTRALLAWLDRSAPGASVVGVSSAAVYGEAGLDPIPETAPMRPVSVYGRHKALMEDALRDAGRPGRAVTTARLFSVYGPFLKKQLPWDLARKLEAGGSLALSGTGEERRDWTWAGDAARALAALEGRSDAAINIARGLSVSVRSFVREMTAAWAVDAAPSFSGARRPGDPFSLVADVSRMAALGLSCPTPVAVGMAAYVAWARAELGVDR